MLPDDTWARQGCAVSLYGDGSERNKGGEKEEREIGPRKLYQGRRHSRGERVIRRVKALKSASGRIRIKSSGVFDYGVDSDGWLGTVNFELATLSGHCDLVFVQQNQKAKRRLCVATT